MKPEYPRHILPKGEFKRDLDVSGLLKEYPRLFFVRQLKGNHSDYLSPKEDGGLTPDPSKIFRGENLANYSINLAGGLFDTSPQGDLRFLPASRDGGGQWEGGDVSPDICENRDSYNVTEPCCGLILRASDVHLKIFPSTRNFESSKDYENYRKDVERVVSGMELEADAAFVGEYKSKKEMVEIRPRVKINHRPTMMNYWHFTMDTYRPNEEVPVMPDDVKSRDKRMFASLVQHLLTDFTLDPVPDYTLRVRDYMNLK